MLVMRQEFLCERLKTDLQVVPGEKKKRRLIGALIGFEALPNEQFKKKMFGK